MRPLGWLLCWWLGGVVAHGQATLSIIQSNGPTATRINLVVLSEGYTAGQLGQFRTDAQALVNALLGTAPFSDYAGYFNAFAIAVASAESGADHPPAVLRNTYFNASFNSYGRPELLTIPPNNFDPNYANGRGKVDALLQALLPEYDLVMLLVNDPTYGGSGGPVLISSLHSSAPDIVRHEAGHTFAGLADEYSAYDPLFTPAEKPNATARTNRAQIRWNVWIDSGVPLPTPPVLEYEEVIGLFEGAQYRPTNWYRPKLNCKMRHLEAPFCEVCAEEIVRSVYRLTPPIESAEPTATKLVATLNQTMIFTVQPRRPEPHALGVQWRTNGVPVPGATQTQFVLVPAALGSGLHTVQVEVRDPTARVRHDPEGLLAQTVTWQVQVSAPELRLIEPRWLPANQFAFGICGNVSQLVVLEYATNPGTWMPLATGQLGGGTWWFTNSAGPLGHRFYRAKLVP